MSTVILGIETSCDETAAAIIDSDRNILAHHVYSQMKTHRAHGGVVPEIAARKHVEKIMPVIETCLDEAGLKPSQLTAFAATCGPGLIGGVMVGMMAAKGMAAALDKPFIAVNHLEAHVLTPRLTSNLEFPYLALLVSGGHTQFLAVESATTMHLLGTTRDDALGEAFDKSAKMMGLPYPGGPEIEKLALKSNDREKEKAYKLPRPFLGAKHADFSFSGLKTAMRQNIEAFPEGPIPETEAAALASAFQHCVVETIIDRCQYALELYKSHIGENCARLAVVGGVAANQYLAQQLADFSNTHNLTLDIAPPALCTDNGAMIAWAAHERYALGRVDTLDFKALPRWPLGKARKNG